MKDINFDILQIVTKEITWPWASSYLITIELGCLLKHQTSPNIFKNFFKKYIVNNFKDFQDVHTDGSKTLESVEFSIIKKKKKLLHKLPNSCFIFTAEAKKED